MNIFPQNEFLSSLTHFQRIRLSFFLHLTLNKPNCCYFSFRESNARNRIQLLHPKEESDINHAVELLASNDQSGTKDA